MIESRDFASDPLCGRWQRFDDGIQVVITPCGVTNYWMTPEFGRAGEMLPVEVGHLIKFWNMSKVAS